MRLRVIIAVAVAFVLNGCGRRTERAWFDAAPPLPSAPSVEAKPLPRTAMHIRWADVVCPREVRPGATVPVSFSITNGGTTLWPDNATADPRIHDGRYAVRVSYAWIAAGEPPESAARLTRVNLPHSIAPGDRVAMWLAPTAPTKPGDYQLVVQLLQEFVLWFSDLGADALTIRVRVVAAGNAAADRAHTP